MKKKLAKIIPAFICAIALCLTVSILCACAPKETATFTGSRDIMTLDTQCTLTHKSDNTCTYVAIVDADETMKNSLEPALARTGTWELKDNVYTVNFVELVVESRGQQVTFDAVTLKSSYNESTKTHTIEYSMPGFNGSFDVTLTYVAE